MRIGARTALLTVALAATGLVSVPTPAAADGPGQGEPWIVSLGDSAISGEGGRWAGNSNQEAAVVDALGDAAYHDELPAGPIRSGSQCLEPVGGQTAGSAVVAAPCSGAPSQTWQLQGDDTILTGAELCLTASGTGVGAAITLAPCDAAPQQQWQRRGDRLLGEQSGRCAAIGGSGLVLADCGGSAPGQALTPPTSGERIDGCHRSRAAAVHIDRSSATEGPVPGGVNSLNLACSGARTYTQGYTPGQNYKPGIDFAPTPAGLPTDHRGQAAELEAFARTHNVSAVTLMIGANNFGYSTVLERCIVNWFFSPSWWRNYCSDDSDIANRVSTGFLSQLSTDVETAIGNVRLAMANAGYDDSMYTVFVNTYWAVMPVASEFRYGQTGYDRQTLGGCGVWNRDANWGESTARPGLNGAVRNAVTRLGAANVVLVELNDIVRGHELCNSDAALLEETAHGHWREPAFVDEAEWITQVRVGPALPDWLNGSPPEYQLQEGGHANYWGQLAMRNCLRQAYNGGAHRGVSCAPAPGGGRNAYGEPELTVTPSP